MTLFLHEIKRGRLALIIWTAAIAFMLAVCVVIYPEMSAQMNELGDMFSDMGAFSEAFGMDQLNFGEFMGYFGIECSNTLGLGGALFAAVLGACALSKEEKDGTAELYFFTDGYATEVTVPAEIDGYKVTVTGMECTFLQLTDLCGYENLTYLMADEEPELETLIARLEEFNCTIIQKYLDMDVDLISIPEDLGMQTGPMISPANFRKYILPSYQRMIGMARAAGKPVHMHSDGDIRTLANDIIEAGCQALNLQDLVNGIDWIAENVKGRVCIDLDVDRQNVTVFGSPKDVDDLIREEVEKLNTPAGGLMLTYGYYAGTPVENADAVATALEKYALHL